MKINLEKKKELLSFLKRPTEKQGKVIELVRESLGLNKEAFSRYIGVTATTVGRWERANTLEKSLTLTADQLANFNSLLNRIGLTVYDLHIDFDIVVPLQDLKTFNLIASALV